MVADFALGDPILGGQEHEICKNLEVDPMFLEPRLHVAVNAPGERLDQKPKTVLSDPIIVRCLGHHACLLILAIAAGLAARKCCICKFVFTRVANTSNAYASQATHV